MLEDVLSVDTDPLWSYMAALTIWECADVGGEGNMTSLCNPWTCAVILEAIRFIMKK
jgi:hypothetical protein